MAIIGHVSASHGTTIYHKNPFNILYKLSLKQKCIELMYLNFELSHSRTKIKSLLTKFAFFQLAQFAFPTLFVKLAIIQHLQPIYWCTCSVQNMSTGEVMKNREWDTRSSNWLQVSLPVFISLQVQFLLTTQVIQKRSFHWTETHVLSVSGFARISVCVCVHNSQSTRTIGVNVPRFGSTVCCKSDFSYFLTLFWSRFIVLCLNWMKYTRLKTVMLNMTIVITTLHL